MDEIEIDENEVKTRGGRMMPRHYLILRYRIEGKTIKEIAELVGMTPQGIGMIVKQPMFQQLEAERRRQVAKMEVSSVVASMDRASADLAMASVRAVERMQEVMETSVDHKVILDASDKILKHAFGLERGSRTTNNVVVLGGEKLEQLREVLREIGVGAGSSNSQASPEPEFVESIPVLPPVDDDFNPASGAVVPMP